MKQKFVKKALAVVLSTAMTFSLSSAAHMQTASAAKKFVGLNTTFKTLKVGQSNYKLKLTNNTIGWKVKGSIHGQEHCCSAEKSSFLCNTQRKERRQGYHPRKPKDSSKKDKQHQNTALPRKSSRNRHDHPDNARTYDTVCRPGSVNRKGNDTDRAGRSAEKYCSYKHYHRHNSCSFL